MSNDLSLGAAIYFDHDLSAEPAPLIRLLEVLFGERASTDSLVQWFHRVDNGRTTPGANYEISAIARKLRREETSTATIESPPKTPDADRVMVLAHTTPSARLPDQRGQTWRYDLVVAVGPTWLARLTASRVVDALVAFADSVSVNAGVILWAESPHFAADLAWAVGGSSSLTDVQRARVTDEMYWRSQWGRVIRGPAWGTFLGAAHVHRLGGIERIVETAGVTAVIRLDSGGAFLQATPIETPIAEDRSDHEPLEHIARMLEPLMGHRSR